jgi:2-keto-4-pentenoate hydratase/2-oxohepta-3-ene-1,7-dioic acid hydratase in catechol pathway
VNGELRQEGSTNDMVFGVAEIFAFISRVMTLLPGDVILTGTPAGVGPIVPGDRVEVTIERIGTLANPVVAGS